MTQLSPKYRPFVALIFCITAVLLLFPLLSLRSLAEALPQPGPAPVFPDGTPLHKPAARSRGGLIVDPQDRETARLFYENYYLPRTADIGWSGNHAACDPGETAQAFRDEIAQRINYFRAMAGVPADIQLAANATSEAQAAALMMSVNNELDHQPPSTWDCYSDEGADGAGSSNLFLGMNGVDAISGYIRDPGTGNGAVGHRRWILYPQTQEMGSGDIPRVNDFLRANALHVFDANIWNARPDTREPFVAWPPPGFVPYQVIYPRWSFSYDDADFTNTTVSLAVNGVAVPVSLEPVANGFGENTVVWNIDGMSSWDDWPPPVQDTVYEVVVSNVGINGELQTFIYTVTVFDPAMDLSQAVYLPIAIR